MSTHVVAVISLTGLGLDLFGALYLAYDLLGGSHGPIRTVTRVLTYSLAWTAFLTLGIGFPFGAIAGAGYGALLGLEYGLWQETRDLKFRSEIFGLLRGAVLGLAGGVSYGLRFGLIGAPLAAFWLVLASRFRFSVASEYTLERSRFVIRPVVLRNQAIRVLGTTAALDLAAIASGWTAHDFWTFTIRYALAAWLGGAIIGSGAPVVEAWADRLPSRSLGFFGTVLILVGFALGSVEYWVQLLGR